MSDFHRASLEMAWLRLCRITNESTELENCYSGLNRELRLLWNSVYVTFLPQNMKISSHCTIGNYAYGTCLNGYAHLSSLFLCAINVAILGNSKSK